MPVLIIAKTGSFCGLAGENGRILLISELHRRFFADEVQKSVL